MSLWASAAGMGEDIVHALVLARVAFLKVAC
jgi:hypothetical protein